MQRYHRCQCSSVQREKLVVYHLYQHLGDVTEMDLVRMIRSLAFIHHRVCMQCIPLNAPVTRYIVGAEAIPSREKPNAAK